MWRWNVLVCVILLHKFSISQPITEDKANDRPPRQLDFGECCPCFDKDGIRHEPGSQEPLAAAAEEVLSRPRDVADCPCRDRQIDPQGASSVFFPTAMRAAGTFLRPGENKEDLKPLFNPEVDLASSVLQTLREVTDEEYKDALERDAAKSAARMVEDIIGDASPQESANLVTIVVNPALTDEDDAIPQASHIQQSRCIHPLQSSKMRMPAKPNLFVYKPRLTKTKPVLLHNVFDNGMHASNVQEHIVPYESPRVLDTDTSPLRVVDSLNLKSTVSNKDADNSCEEKGSDFGALTDKKTIFDLNKPSLLESIQKKLANPLLRPPKKLKTLLVEKSRKDGHDPNSAASIVNEQKVKNVPYLRTNVLESLKQKSRPLSITNLLNLKDVEIIPVKDLLKISKPKPLSVIDNTERSSNKYGEVTMNEQGSQIMLKHNNVNCISSDPEESPSTISQQTVPLKAETTSDNDCDGGISEFKSDTSVEKDASNAISATNIDTLPNTQDELPTNAVPENGDCLDNEKVDQDSITDSSNIVNNIIEQNETIQEIKSPETPKMTPDEVCDEEDKKPLISQESIKKKDSTSKFSLLDTSLIDKTISNIKENIAKKLEDLKNIKTRNKDTFNREVIDTDENKEIARNENSNQDCQNDASVQVTTLSSGIFDGDLEDVTTTIQPISFENPEIIRNMDADSPNNLADIVTLKPDSVNDHTTPPNDCFDKAVSLQDLQRLSDSILQKEEQERNNVECNESFDEIKGEPSINDSRAVDSLDSQFTRSSESVDNQDVVENPDNVDNFSETDLKGACNSNLPSSQTLLPAQDDANVEASEVVLSNVPQSKNIISSQPILEPKFMTSPLPSVSDLLKLPARNPSPVMEDIKLKLSNLFDKNERNVHNISVPETEQNINPVMTSAASTSSYQTRMPSSRLLEDLNLDKFKFKSQPAILPNIPKFNLQSYKTKLPLPKDLSLKQEKPSLLSATYNKPSSVLNKPLNVKPRVGTAKDLLSDSPLEATHHFHSTLKNTQKAFESRLRQAANNNLNLLKSPAKSSSSLLDSISRNHEDISDKLKGLHMDLNDRLETMRNDLFDRSKLLKSGSRHSKHNLGSISKQKKGKQPLKNTWQASTRGPLKLSTPRKPGQQKPIKITSPSKTNKQHSFRMPGAASVPVPSTMQVPELKKTSESGPSLLLKHDSNVMSKWKSTIPETKTWAPETASRLNNNLQTTNPLIRKPFSMKKESNIIVSFSTTPRPTTLNQLNSSPYHLQNSNPGQTRMSFGSQMRNDHDGSPTELKQAKLSGPFSDHLHTQKYSKKAQETDSSSRKLALTKESKLKTPELENLAAKTALRSWPKADDSAFLTKVREAVQTRLSKVNSPKTLKQSGLQVNPGKDEIEVMEFNSDMARSATENKEIIEESPLKENVSYKCKMVCTKE